MRLYVVVTRRGLFTHMSDYAPSLLHPDDALSSSVRSGAAPGPPLHLRHGGGGPPRRPRRCCPFLPIVPTAALPAPHRRPRGGGAAPAIIPARSAATGHPLRRSRPLHLLGSFCSCNSVLVRPIFRGPDSTAGAASRSSRAAQHRRRHRAAGSWHRQCAALSFLPREMCSSAALAAPLCCLLSPPLQLAARASDLPGKAIATHLGSSCFS
jgi:hypothetical protein